MTRGKWIRAVAKSVADECGEDFVGLWVILSRVRGLRLKLSADEQRAATLEIVRMLISTDQIATGNPTIDGKFVGWSEVGSAAIQRIEHEWDALGKAPSIGDIVWFVRRDDVEVVSARPGQTGIYSR